MKQDGKFHVLKVTLAEKQEGVRIYDAVGTSHPKMKNSRGLGAQTTCCKRIIKGRPFWSRLSSLA